MKKVLALFLSLILLFLISCSKIDNNTNDNKKKQDEAIEDIIIERDKKDTEEKNPVEEKHICNHVCPICGKCQDKECKDLACSDKCYGHEEEPEKHVCNHICPICGKCLDLECKDLACSDKCYGHEEEPEKHVCNHICPICGKCQDKECKDLACSDKCYGHEEEPEKHICNHICPICGKCQDKECKDSACSDKCLGHEELQVIEINELYVSLDEYNLKLQEGFSFIAIDSNHTDLYYNKDINKDCLEYKFYLTVDETYKFSEDLILHWQKKEKDLLEIKSYDIIDGSLVIYTIKYYDVIKTININLDTLNYTVSYESNEFSAEIKKPLDYIYIYTLVTFENPTSVEFEFIVNGNVIEKDKYTIEGTDNGYLLTYRVEDPNWTPYY